ncbi:MAG: phosphoribosylglycinamide formyltransferase [Armatimonadetes bacterium]|nr:phosphoribosylglycinamide formyltransferase [Armatimonadota bacterium]
MAHDPNISPLRLAVFVGSHGRGSNLFAIHDAINAGTLPAQIVCVVGSRADAPAIVRARNAGLVTKIVSPKDRTDPEYAAVLLRVLRGHDADSVALAGYMRRLPEAVVAAFPNRVVNIHPSLLPAFGGHGMYGEKVHQAVMDSGVKVSGCTVHFVDENFDTGAIISQTVVDVLEGDTAQTLAARVLECEHRAFAEALTALARGQLRVVGRRVVRTLLPSV